MMLRSFFCVSSSTVPLSVKVPIRSSYMRVARVRSTPENFTLAAMVASRSWRMKRSALIAADETGDLLALLLDKAVGRRQRPPGVLHLVAEKEQLSHPRVDADIARLDSQDDRVHRS